MTSFAVDQKRLSELCLDHEQPGRNRITVHSGSRRGHQKSSIGNII